MMILARFLRVVRPALVAGVVNLAAAAALGQANYAESFDNLGSVNEAAGGPSALLSRGWIFRNQSRPSGSGLSPYWAEFFGGWGQAGSCLGHGGFATWQDSSSKISAWAILPAIPGQRAGDPLSIGTSAPTDAFGNNPATLEIRYAPSGTSTGSGENAIGDFSTLLMSISGAGGHPWTERRVTLPGAGRVALRLVVGPGSAPSVLGGSMLVDTLQVGTPPPPPYPIPSPGQTVHWTTTHSPVQIARTGSGLNPVIPSGATVVIDQGVEVRVVSGAQLEISGIVRAAGTPALPVRLRGPGSFLIRPGGLLDADHADVEMFTDPMRGGRVWYRDSSFRDPSNPTGFSYNAAGDIGLRFSDGSLAYERQIVRLDRCTFGQGCSVAIQRGWLAARDCTFHRGGWVRAEPGPVGGEAMFIVGNAILDNVTVTDGYIDLMLDKRQPRYIGNVSATGNPYGPGIRLQGGANYFIDPSVTLQGNKWPVNIGFSSAGILPGSRLPATGNQLNEIPDTDDSSPLDERVIWADAGIPYSVWNGSVTHGQITILPGVTVRIHPDIAFFFDTDSHGAAMPIFLGEPERPIRFMPYVPGQRWAGVTIGSTLWFGTRWDWCIFEDSARGTGAAELPIAYDNCVFRRNVRGVGGSSRAALRKCTFENNIYSYSGERFAPNHVVDGFLDANHPANPNTFVNNRGNPGEGYELSFLPMGGLIARSRHNSLENSDSDVRNNWWGTPDGPRHPVYNPGGTGDDVFFGIDPGGFLLPFLAEPPTSNPPPVVRFVTAAGLPMVPGEKVILQWTARDDGRITAQRVYFSPASNIDENMQLLAEIPGAARSFEWTVPHVGTSPANVEEFFRIVAVDDLGQEGIADLPMRISNPGVIPGVISPSPAVSGTLAPGAGPPICYTATQSGVATGVALECDNDDTGVSLGGLFPQPSITCLPLSLQVPDVSTDRARIRYDYIATLNQVKSFYGPYFSIRPDAMLGDAPPTVALTSSHTGQTYAGGTHVPIAWEAADDEALRSFDIRASFDGGTRWFIVVRDLPAEARGYTWTLPASSGIPDVRIRVVARDLRYQNTSAESGAFAVSAGSPVACPGDFNSDGAATIQDLFDFLVAYFAGDARADINGVGGVTIQDVFDFLVAYFAGCP